MERPHPPGYPFFVLIGQIIVSLSNTDPHTAILILNKIFVFFGIVVCYKFVKTYWSSSAAVISVLLIACNPVVLFYGSVGEIYIYDLFFSVAAIYLMLGCKPKFIPLAFFLIGLSMGFRLPSIILLAPVIVTILFVRSDREEFLSLKNISLSLLTFVLGTLIWAIPFYFSRGGFSALIQALYDANKLDTTIYQNTAAYLSFFLWTVNIGCLVYIFIKRKNISSLKYLRIVLLTWFIAPTLFYIFKHYSKGYILLILPAIIIPIAARISSVENAFAKRTITALIIIANISLFAFMPFMQLPFESALPKAQRSASERIKTALIRPFYYFAPTYSHITESDEAMTEVNLIIEHYVSPFSMICVDRSAEPDPRSLQAAHPSLYFVKQNINDSTTVSLFYGKDVDWLFPVPNILTKDTLFLLVGTEFTNSFGAPTGAQLLTSGQYTSLYIVVMKDKNLFWKYFTAKIK